LDVPDHLTIDDEPVDSTAARNALSRLKFVVRKRLATRAKTVQETPAAPEESPLSWQDVAERLKRLRQQGERFTSQKKMAEQLRCSAATINKAIHQTPALLAWATKPPAAPRAHGLTDAELGSTPQDREPNPMEDAADRAYLDRDDLTCEDRGVFHWLARAPELRACFLQDPDKYRLPLRRFWKLMEAAGSADKAAFLAMPLEAQLLILNDPDKHPKILGRKA
jgi:hypothetical protein